MIIYRRAERRVRPAAELERLRRYASARDTTSFLVAAGELEQGIVDGIRPSVDGWGATEALLRRATMIAAAAYLEAGAGRAAEPLLQRSVAGFTRALRRPLPAEIVVHVPEGYAHYALDPAGYAAAAATYRAAVGVRHARSAVVVGVRSIGTSLAAVVARVLGSARTLTVRPRGESGARRIAADSSLLALLGAWRTAASDVLIVDEGPGATGETLAVVADWVRGLGIDDARIILFPSHGGAPALAPEERRAWFAAARKYPPPLGDARPGRIAARLGLSAPHDLSGGQWRAVVPHARALPASGAHERGKYRAHDVAGVAHLLRYAGLGRWGEAPVARAARLAAIGLGPEPMDLADGFLLSRWLDGTPAPRRAGRDPALLTALDAYLRARAPLFRTGQTVATEPILEMLVANATEALGPAAPGLPAAARRLSRLAAREAVIPDGRLHAHEWLRTPSGYHKVDALDHGDGLRLPGPTDPAWDLAGAAIELGLDDVTLAQLTRRCAEAAGTDAAELHAAVAAYRAPYSALWLADALLAVREATGPDRRRMAAEAARYRATLALELRRAAEAPMAGRAA